MLDRSMTDLDNFLSADGVKLVSNMPRAASPSKKSGRYFGQICVVAIAIFDDFFSIIMKVYNVFFILIWYFGPICVVAIAIFWWVFQSLWWILLILLFSIPSFKGFLNRLLPIIYIGYTLRHTHTWAEQNIYYINSFGNVYMAYTTQRDLRLHSCGHYIHSYMTSNSKRTGVN